MTPKTPTPRDPQTPSYRRSQNTPRCSKTSPKITPKNDPRQSHAETPKTSQGTPKTTQKVPKPRRCPEPPPRDIQPPGELPENLPKRPGGSSQNRDPPIPRDRQEGSRTAPKSLGGGETPRNPPERPPRDRDPPKPRLNPPGLPKTSPGRGAPPKPAPSDKFWEFSQIPPRAPANAGPPNWGGRGQLSPPGAPGR